MSLPSNWTSASILTCGTFIRGVTYKKQEASTTTKPGYARILRANNISTRNISTEEIIYAPLKNISETQILQSGDILIATSSGSPSVVGKAAQIKNDTDMSFGAFCGVIRPHRDLNPEYIGHFFSSKQYRDRISKLARGTNINNIKQEHFESIKIPLAPINEQRRIADKLDRVLARVDAANEHLSRVAPHIKRFRQSVLAAATSGRLTADWRTGKKSEPWDKTAIHEVAEVGTGSTPLRTNRAFYADKGTPWITSSATQKDIVDSSENYVTQDAIQAHRLKLYPPGTLLIAMYGEGKTRGQVTELGIHATINQACAAIRITSDKTHPKFVKIALKARYNEMRDMAEGGNQPNLNLQKVKNFAIPLPSLEEQSEIVRRVEKLFAFADRLEERLSQVQTAVQKLTPALLAKAFRGELVPQDPNDEPASELLKRLQESRTESAKPRRAHKPRARKAP